MTRKIVIISEEHRNLTIAIIKALPLAPEHEIIIREHKKDRSAGQNALMWVWLTIIGAYLGESKDDLHERFKDKWLVSIYERDDPEYAEMIQALRAVWRQGMKKEALELRKRIVALTSTTTATVPQMAEYLAEMENFAMRVGVKLPSPGEG